MGREDPRRPDPAHGLTQARRDIGQDGLAVSVAAAMDPDPAPGFAERR